MNDEHNHISAFGGTSLEFVKGIESKHSAKLADFGVHDAEQLLGMVTALGGHEPLAKALGVPTAELASTISLARKTIPAPVAADLDHPSPIKYSLGALLPTDKSKADMELMMASSSHLETAIAPGGIPPAVNHAAGMQPVQNQGARGTCVSFGSTAMHEYLLAVHGAKLKFSEQFLYDEIKKIDGFPNACGTWLTYAVRILTNLGQCVSSVWPYNPNLPCNNNGVEPSNARAKAAIYRSAPRMLAARNVLALKGALAANNTVAFCIPVYNSWYLSPTVKRTGQITMRVGNEPAIGGHCMCFIGYQDAPFFPGGGYFILRNSWGTSWGSLCPYGAGNGTIPYQYLANEGTEAASY